MFSREQFHQHMNLWKNYEKTYKKMLKEKPQGDREWNKNFLYNREGYLLHNFFFGQFADDPSGIGPLLSSQIRKDFGSISQWRKVFSEMAAGCRPAGWAILCWSNIDGKLTHILADDHTEFGLDMHIILILDMYEHAYFIDYGSDKKQYIQDFLDQVDYQIAEERLAYLID